MRGIIKMVKFLDIFSKGKGKKMHKTIENVKDNLRRGEGFVEKSKKDREFKTFDEF